MRILDRYLVKGFLSPFTYCLALFSVLFVVVDSFNHLSDFLRHKTKIEIILSYYLYLLPTLIVQMVPIASLVSILYILGTLSKHNEITAIKASGVSTKKILTPYLFMALVISFAVLLMNETVVPRAAMTSTAIMEGLIQKGRQDLNERAIKNVTLYGKDNRLYFAREFEVTTGTLYDVSILEDSPEQVLQSKLTAKKARYENGVWAFYDAIEFRLNAEGDIVGEPEFAARLLRSYDERPDDFIRGASQVEFMNARELNGYIKRLKGAGDRLVGRLKVDLHSKIAFPFTTMIVMLIGAPLAMRTGRGSAMVGIGTSIFIIVLYYGIDSVCLALGKGGHLPPMFSAWFGNLFFAAVGIYLIKNSS